MEEFKTFPLANEHRLDPKTGIAIPSTEDVKVTKDWVDFNEK